MVEIQERQESGHGVQCPEVVAVLVVRGSMVRHASKELPVVSSNAES